jgi:hypothetical protein
MARQLDHSQFATSASWFLQSRVEIKTHDIFAVNCFGAHKCHRLSRNPCPNPGRIKAHFGAMRHDENVSLQKFLAILQGERCGIALKAEYQEYLSLQKHAAAHQS